MYMHQEEAEFTTVLGEDVEFTGDIETNESLLVKGKIANSEIKASMILLSANGIISGKVDVETFVILGNAEGTFHIGKILCLARGGELQGDATVSSLLVEEGGVLNGSCIMKTSVPGSLKESVQNSQ